MIRKVLIVLLAVFCFSSIHLAEAQEASRLNRNGYVSTASLTSIGHRAEFSGGGLRELGYVEEKNIGITPLLESVLDRWPCESLRAKI
jgi:hypothetical protein